MGSNKDGFVRHCVGDDVLIHGMILLRFYQPSTRTRGLGLGLGLGEMSRSQEKILDNQYERTL